MDEHDDDLESEVQSGAEKELNAFPKTGDELEDGDEGVPAEQIQDEPLDEDAAEL